MPLANYYKILCIDSKANEDDIKKAYHTLARKYHPDKNQEPDAEQHFKKISEAYRILSDKKQRNDYDLEAGFMRKRKYPKYIPTDFPLGTNPYDVFGMNKHMTYENSKIKNSDVYRFEMYDSISLNKEAPIEHELFVTLEELSTGVVRKMKISRVAYGGQRMEDKVIDVYVRPGCKTGTKIVFAREGDRLPGKTPADVVFIVREKLHEFFERLGADLEYIANVPLKVALSGNFVVDVPTLEGKVIKICVRNTFIRQNMVKCIPRKGLPHHLDRRRRGDLRVVFNIKHSKNMSAFETILEDGL